MLSETDPDQWPSSSSINCAAAEPKIEKVSDSNGSHFELQNVPEGGKERLSALFQVLPLSIDHQRHSKRPTAGTDCMRSILSWGQEP